MPSVEYSIAAFGAMIADDVRMSAYALALERTIRPGCTVLDIGTGTGVMALLACRFGAGKVVAIEPDDVIEVARQRRAPMASQIGSSSFSNDRRK